MDKTPSDAQLKTWRLFLTAHARLTREIDERLARANVIPLNWYDVLIELYEAPDHRLRMSELAERVLLTRSGLTRLADRLEAAGYLRRIGAAGDRRSVQAQITRQGIEAMRHAWPVYAAAIVERFAQNLTEPEAAVLRDAFERLLAQTDA
jgi:DNA-binding MarR family transcriptional regulator